MVVKARAQKTIKIKGLPLFFGKPLMRYDLISHLLKDVRKRSDTLAQKFVVL